MWIFEAEVTHSCSPRCRTSVALWSTGCSPGGITIGRMTATGTVTIYAVQNISSPGRHHRRTGRSHVVHRQRQRYWPDHHLSDTHDQSIHPHLGSGRNNGHHHRPQPGQATKVSFGGTAATIVSDTATWVVTKVLTGALTGPILVTTAAGTATSIKIFKVT